MLFLVIKLNLVKPSCLGNINLNENIQSTKIRNSYINKLRN